MVNKVILIGNVGQEPETKEVGQTQVSKISLATTETWKDKSGEKKSRTEWHSLEVWGNLCKVVESYVKKGDRLYIEGSIKYDSYEKDGITKYSTKIKVVNLTMLGGKSSTTPQTETPVKPAIEQIAETQTEDELPF